MFNGMCATAEDYVLLFSLMLEPLQGPRCLKYETVYILALTMVWDNVCVMISERDELQHRVQELDTQINDLVQKVECYIHYMGECSLCVCVGVCVCVCVCVCVLSSWQNRDLQVENEEIVILRDSVEEMKYMESKVVRVSHDNHMIITLYSTTKFSPPQKNYESMIHQYKKKLGIL